MGYNIVNMIVELEKLRLFQGQRPRFCLQIVFWLTLLNTAWHIGPQPVAFVGLFGQVIADAELSTTKTPKSDLQQARILRIATFNASLSRDAAGALLSELRSPDSEQIQLVAEVIQRIRPDILLINEMDFDAKHEALELFSRNFLQISQNNQLPIRYDFSFTAPVNTGVDSGLDLNNNGELGEPEDAFGYGRFPGQYGMTVFSKHQIDTASIRTFQKLLWKDLPDPMWPINADGRHYYSEAAMQRFRISSKSHWIVPVKVDSHIIHLLCSHPTPPVFDGPEDRNGRRNHDEIRLLRDIIDNADYLVDDQGQSGGLAANSRFVVLGDLNCDPFDGDSEVRSIRLLLEHPSIDTAITPSSLGGQEAAIESGGANKQHRGDAAHDTGDFNDRVVGNLRADYALPSRQLKLKDAGVFWPIEADPLSYLNQASDHRLVWIDVQLPMPSNENE